MKFPFKVAANHTFIVALAMLIVASAFILWRVQAADQEVSNVGENLINSGPQESIYASSLQTEEKEDQQKAGSSDNKQENTTQTSDPTSSTPVSASKPVPVKTESKFKGCAPKDANKYDLTYAGLTTSQYLKQGTYTSTKEFKKALDFAGLTSLVDQDQVVVFAVADLSFDNLTDEQYDYIYSSKSRMKKLLGWQIVLSCEIRSGNLENVSSKTTIKTLNGNLTFTQGGPPKVNGVTVGIFDFFTKNGAVHYTSFFDTSALP